MDLLHLWDEIFAAADAARQEAWAASPELTEFAEQFRVDVSQISTVQRSAVTTGLGANAFTFVQVCYADDARHRLKSAFAQLFGRDPFEAETSGEAPALWPALERMMNSVAQMHDLDPVTTELIRLRGANAHNCRICKSRRSNSAVADGGLDLLNQVDDFETAPFTDKQKAALRLTDAILWQPGEFPATVIADAHHRLSEAEIVEVVMDVIRNASNKIAVALAADQPAVTEGYEFFDVTAAGMLVVT